VSKTLCDWLIIKGTGYTQCYNMVKPGAAVLEGFLRFPETTQGFPSMMGAPFFSYKVSRGIHSGLNSGVTGFCFDLKLRKCSEDLFFFFWLPRRKIGDLHKNLCCSVTGNSAQRSHRTRTAKVCDKQAVWKLLSKISRTAPGLNQVSISVMCL